MYRKCFLALSSCIIVFIFLLQCVHCLPFDTSACGQSKRCVFGACSRQNDPSSCQYLFAVAPDSERPNRSVQIELYTKRSSPDVRYIAVGFSEDTLMGDDSVTYCVLNDNQKMEAHLSVNPPADKSNVPAEPGAEEGTLELLESAASDDGIYCRVRQQSKPAHGQKDLVKPDLQARPFHLLFAKGTATEPRVIGIHSLDATKPDEFPFASAQPLLVLDPKLVQSPAGQQQNGDGQSAGGGGLDLIDLHGILMVIAWLAMTIVAIYSARYMRNAWPHTTVMGLKIWFHIHRTLNFLAVLIIVAAVVSAVLNKQRWTGPWFGRPQIGLGGWHSLAGALSTLFALSQPIGALMRCSVDHPRRPVFNWLHRCLGLAALLLAQVAMFIALYNFRKHFAFPDVAFWLLVFFYAALLLIIVISEVLRLMELKEQRKLNAIEMQSRNRGSTPSDAYYYHSQKSTHSKLFHVRKTLFTVTAAVCAGTAAILVLLILFH